MHKWYFTTKCTNVQSSCVLFVCSWKNNLERNFFFLPFACPVSIWCKAQKEKLCSKITFTFSFLPLFLEKFNVLWRDNWTSHASKVIRRYEELVIHKAKSEGYAGGEDQGEEGTVQWNFSGALLYSVTVITTIGKKIDQTFRCICWNEVITLQGYQNMHPNWVQMKVKLIAFFNFALQT